MNEPKILQIIPAPAGMSAVHEDDRGGMYEEPIVALALVEGCGERVVALEMDDSGSTGIVEYTPNFVSLLFNGDHLAKREEDK